MIEFLLGILLLLVFNSLVCVGFYKATEFYYHPDAIAAIGHIPEGSDKRGITNDSKQVLWFIRYYSEKYLGRLSKPVCSCLRCMASLWSILFWVVVLRYMTFDVSLLITYLLYIPALSTMNQIIEEKLLL